MPEKIPILGVRIDPVTVDDVLARLRSALTANEPILVTHVHVMGMNLAYRQPWLRDFFNAADIVYCDGQGVRLGSHLLGRPLPARLTLADWMDRLMQLLVETGKTVYFLGNPPGVTARAAETLQAQFPGLHIAGTHDGYFDADPESPENQALLADIRSSAPDLVLVGMGMPRQERWVLENRPQLPGMSFMTVGGVFEYWGGSLTRSPRWMTENGLEWLALTLQAPGRYWKRHLLGNPVFLFRVLRERWFG